MPENGRWLIGLVAGIVLISVFLSWRGHRNESEPDSVAPARAPTRSKSASTPGGAPVRARAGARPEEAANTANGGDTSAAVPGRLEAAGGVPTPASGLPGAMKRGANPAGSVAGAGEDEVPAVDENGQALGNPTPGSGPAFSAKLKGSLESAVGPPIIVQGIQVDPTSGIPRFPPTASLAYGDSGGLDPAGQGTIAMWIKEDVVPSNHKALLELRTNTWQNRLELGMGPTRIGLLMTNSDGVEQGVSVPIKWVPGVWHHVGATWGDEIMSIYVDGALGEQSPYSGSFLIPSSTPLYVCSSRAAPSSDQGQVMCTGLNVFQYVLSPEDIATLVSQDPPTQ